MNNDINEIYVAISEQLIIKRLSKLDLVVIDFAQKHTAKSKK